jgi:hypothetical protein
VERKVFLTGTPMKRELLYLHFFIIEGVKKTQDFGNGQVELDRGWKNPIANLTGTKQGTVDTAKGILKITRHPLTYIKDVYELDKSKLPFDRQRDFYS